LNQYFRCILCKPLEEIIKIIKEKKPGYFKTAVEFINDTDLYIDNAFIMKKGDFFKYCDLFLIYQYK
jgi:hypothetical protein